MPITDPNFILFTIPVTPGEDSKAMLVEFMAENKLINENTEFMIVDPGLSKLYEDALKLFEEQAVASGFKFSIVDQEKAIVRIQADGEPQDKHVLVVWTPKVRQPNTISKWLH